MEDRRRSVPFLPCPWGKLEQTQIMGTLIRGIFALTSLTSGKLNQKGFSGIENCVSVIHNPRLCIWNSPVVVNLVSWKEKVNLKTVLKNCENEDPFFPMTKVWRSKYDCRKTIELSLVFWKEFTRHLFWLKFQFFSNPHPHILPLKVLSKLLGTEDHQYENTPEEQLA